MLKLRPGFRVALGAALLAAAGAVFASEATPPKASIPFANHGGIRDWKADRDQGLWVQDIHRQWYYAKLMGPCIGLNFAQTIGFDTHPLGRFDQFSSIYVPGGGGGRCAVQSFTLSGAPPSGKVKSDAKSGKVKADPPSGKVEATTTSG
jgi:hypothetical protein